MWVREALPPSPFHTLRTESERLRLNPSKDYAEKLGREKGGGGGGELGEKGGERDGIPFLLWSVDWLSIHF